MSRPLLAFLWLFGWAAFSGVAAAQSCPTGEAVARLDHGTRVKLVDIHPADLYHPRAASLIGMTGTVDGEVFRTDGCWMGGGFYDDAGTYYYFYKAAFVALSAPRRAATCPSSAVTAGVTSGARVKVLDVHPDDAYYSTAGAIVGLSGTVREPLTVMDGCWLAGGLDGDDGIYYYFYKAAFTRLSAPTACPPGASSHTTVSAGSRVKLLGLHPDDAYAYRAGELVGLAGTVREELFTIDGCWLAGGVDGDDGTYYYFYKGAFQPLSSSTRSASSGRSPSPSPKSKAPPRRSREHGFVTVGGSVAPGFPPADLGDGLAHGFAVTGLARAVVSPIPSVTVLFGRDDWTSDGADGTSVSRNRVEVDVGAPLPIVRKSLTVALEPWLGVGAAWGHYVDASDTEVGIGGFGLAYGLAVPIVFGARPVIELRPGASKTPYGVGTSEITGSRQRQNLPALTGFRLEAGLSIGLPANLKR